MKTAIVIFSRNATGSGIWEKVLDAVDRQDFQPDERIVVDSASDDRTVPVALERNWKTMRVRREDFDHGLTRNRIVRNLEARGFDAAVFLSQDVILASPDALGKIVGFLRDHPVAGCFGRQIDTRRHTLEGWQRERCYPEKSQIKTLADAPRMKLLTPFCSNAFAAWKIAEVVARGGFPRTMFGEDMLFAAKTLESGGSIGYCAEAVAIHEHPEDVRGLFLRGKAVGEFHRFHPELLRRYGSPARPRFGAGFLRIAPQFMVKSFGYAWGRFRERLTPWLVFALLWLLLAPAIMLYDFPQKDVAFRYAPMAEAFAAGDWYYAFHPRVPPMLPVCAGVLVRVLSCGGYPACQLAAGLILSFGVFPLYWGTRRAYGYRVATTAALLYAGCVWLLRLGYYGLREPFCIFGVLLLFLAAVRLRMRSSTWRWYLVFAAGEAILLMARGDVALFVLATLLLLLGWDIRRHHHPLRSLGVLAVLLVLMLPVLHYNYRMIGYPVPEVRHAAFMRKLAGRFKWLEKLKNPHPYAELDIKMPTVEASDE